MHKKMIKRKISIFIIIALCFCIFQPLAEESYALAAKSRTPEYVWYLTDIGCDTLWDTLEQRNLVPGEETVVAVIDSGINPDLDCFSDCLYTNEAELYGEENVDDDGNGYVDDIHGVNLADSYTYLDDTNGHGSQMSSIIAGKHITNRSLRTITGGVAYGAKILPIKVSDDINFNSEVLCEGLQYAVDMGADVINLSCITFSNDSTLRKMVDYATAHSLVIASAGNQSLPTVGEHITEDTSDGYPAAWDGVIGVMAYDTNKELASFSNWDQNENTPKYQLIAPGENIICTNYDGTLRAGMGTSQACAVVSGCAAVFHSLVQGCYASIHEERSAFLNFMNSFIQYENQGITYNFRACTMKEMAENMDEILSMPQVTPMATVTPTADASASVSPVASGTPEATATPEATTAPDVTTTTSPEIPSTITPGNITFVTPGNTATVTPGNTATTAPGTTSTTKPTAGVTVSPDHSSTDSPGTSTGTPGTSTPNIPSLSPDAVTPTVTPTPTISPENPGDRTETPFPTGTPDNLITPDPDPVIVFPTSSPKSDLVGKTFVRKGIRYRILKNRKLKVLGPKSRKFKRKTLKLPKKILYQNVRYKVSVIRKKAFKKFKRIKRFYYPGLSKKRRRKILNRIRKGKRIKL